MKLKSSLALSLTAIAALWGGASFAHHSFAVFDMDKTLAITGTVNKWVWANPHAWIYMTVVRADGTTLEWAFECSSPNMMTRWGWKYRDIKVGDKLTIDTHPSRDGSPHGSVHAVYLANGKVLADPMGRPVTGDQLAQGPPSVPTQPQGEPYR